MDFESINEEVSDIWEKSNLEKPNNYIGTDIDGKLYLTIKDRQSIYTFLLIEKELSDKKVLNIGRAYMIPGKYCREQNNMHFITRPDKLILVQCGAHASDEELGSYLNDEHYFVLETVYPNIEMLLD